jgi:Cu(I)/Ag(I) efflux system membrane fusion protein
VSASAAPDAVRGVRPGGAVAATIEGRAASAVVEGIVPAPGGNLYTVNAIVDNRARAHLPGSAATLALPQGARQAIVVPAAAVRREGELTGVLLRAPGGDELRWVRLGREVNGLVEVLGGLSAGERVVVPAATPAAGGRPGGE